MEAPNTPLIPGTAGKLISDAAIVAGLAGWAAVVAAALLAPPPPPRLLRVLGVSAAAYMLAGGSIRHGDTPLVGAMKEGWQRARPSPVHSTYAFPRCALCPGQGGSGSAWSTRLMLFVAACRASGSARPCCTA